MLKLLFSKKRLTALLAAASFPALFLLLSIRPLSGESTGYYENPDTEYIAFVDDGADLFTPEEEEDLLNRLSPMTAYGHAGVVTTGVDPYGNSETFAQEYLADYFGDGTSDSILLIDMDTRNLTIMSDGANLRKINRSTATVITDNIYRYAKDGDYYGCAAEAVDEMNAVLEGERIARPMKYLSNAALAILLGLLLNYVFVRFLATPGKASEGELIASMYSQYRFENPREVHTTTTKEYVPRSSSSSGGGGGRSFGGGGGHSSGGGSHGF
ncbi:MAG: TPM domain-containing protein [Lachnospiraceae bacterium]|nr:TPM domain-containing protein [Lachnospiraceae bacterium]